MFSYWEKITFLQKVDYLIIGAGYTGLWTALELRKKYPTASIGIIEKGFLPTGASTKNAGFSCFGSPTELINDAAKNGKEAMWDITFKRYEGLRKIHNTFSYNAISYENTGGYECLDSSSVEKVSNALPWLNEEFYNLTGNKSCFKFDENKHGLKGFEAIVKNKLEGCLNPAKLVKALVDLAHSKSISIYYNIPVEKIDFETGDVITSIGNLKANKLFICTNGFTEKLLPEITITPQRGQIIMTQPIPNLQLKGSYHYDEGFYYFRNVNDQILIGGARNKNFETEQTTAFENTTLIVNELLDFIDKHITPKNQIEITHQWSGIMGFTENKKPVIRALSKNTFCAVGLSGMGVALSPIIAEEVVSLLTV